MRDGGLKVHQSGCEKRAASDLVNIARPFGSVGPAKRSMFQQGPGRAGSKRGTKRGIRFKNT